MTKQDMVKEFSNWSDAIRLAEGFNFDNVVDVLSADEVVDGDDVKLTARFSMVDESVVEFVAECDGRGFVIITITVCGDQSWRSERVGHREVKR